MKTQQTTTGSTPKQNSVVPTRNVCCPQCGLIQPVDSLGGLGWLFTLEDDDNDTHQWWCIPCGYSAAAEVGWTIFVGTSKPTRQIDRTLF